MQAVQSCRFSEGSIQQEKRILLKTVHHRAFLEALLAYKNAHATFNRSVRRSGRSAEGGFRAACSNPLRGGLISCHAVA